MLKQRGYTVIELFMSFFLLVLLPICAWGWVWNIIKLIGMTIDPITGLLIVRVIGIFIPPIGVIVGFL